MVKLTKLKKQVASLIRGALDMAEVVCSNHTGPIVLFAIRGIRAVHLPIVEFADYDEKHAQQGQKVAQL